MANELKNKIAVVTGSSSGLGRAIAEELAAAGAHIFGHARRNAAGGQALVARVRELGRDAHFELADLASEGEQDRLVDAAWRWRDGVDIWVNAAGADVLTGETRQWTFEEKLALLWRVDVVATMRLSRQIGSRMVQQAGSVKAERTILNVGWDQAEHGMAGDSGEMFGAIKGAIMAFTKSLARSLAPHVRVNCLAPGWIKTAWGEQASDYWQQRAIAESLVQRWGLPSDVAQAARFLASPNASFVTGQTLVINGGFRHRD